MELSRLRAVWSILVLALACACAGNAALSLPNTPVATHERLPVRFRTGKKSNGGAALHVLAREVRKTEFPRIEYEDVAAALQTKEDPKTLEWLVLLPNEECIAELDRPIGTDVAIYFLFAAPSEEWRTLIPSEQKQPVSLSVAEHGICAAQTAAECQGVENASNDSQLVQIRCRSFGD